MAEVQKEEAVAVKVASTEGVKAVLGGRGGEETEERREKMSVETMN